MPKFKAKWVTRYDPKTRTNVPRIADSAGEVVKFEMDSTDSDRGELESMRAKIDKLGDVLAKTIDSLPPAAQVEIINNICGWDEVEE